MNKKIELDSGVYVCSLQDLAHYDAGLVERYCTVLSVSKKGKQPVVPKACWDYVVALVVPRGVMIKDPLELQPAIELYDDERKAEQIVVIIDDGASVMINNQLIYIGSIDYYVGACSSLKVLHNCDGSGSHVIARERFYCNRESVLSYYLSMPVGMLIPRCLELYLMEPGARAQVVGVCVVGNVDQLKLEVQQYHYAPRTHSDVLIKSVVSGQAQATYKSGIVVAQKAQHSHAVQRYKTLILSDDACVITHPALDVLANDVKCVHGSAIGQLDNEQLGYVQARGLSYQQAERLLIKGFLQECVGQMPSSVSLETLLNCIVST